MKLGTVIGNVVATAHHPAYDAKKMMVVKLDDAAVGAPEGDGQDVDALPAAAEDKLWAAVRSVLQSGPPKKKAKLER